MKLFLCNPRGFCAGVVRAIKTVEKALRKWKEPIYVKHEIVHNSNVIKRLEKMGAIFIEDIEKVPKNSKIIYSAHGVSPEDREISKKRGLLQIDATCPLVTQNHELVKKYSNMGYKIILIGHKKHPEVIATANEAPFSTFIVENASDIENLKFSKFDNIFYLTQTTLSLDEDLIDKIEKKYPKSKSVGRSSICYATFNRQSALRSILNKVDLVLVIGDKKSSNSNRLKEIAINKNICSYLINSENEIKKSWFKNVKTIGMTSGASTPEKIVQNCIFKIKKIGLQEIEEIFFTEEKVSFPLPKILNL